MLSALTADSKTKGSLDMGNEPDEVLNRLDGVPRPTPVPQLVSHPPPPFFFADLLGSACSRRGDGHVRPHAVVLYAAATSRRRGNHVLQPIQCKAKAWHILRIIGHTTRTQRLTRRHLEPAKRTNSLLKGTPEKTPPLCRACLELRFRGDQMEAVDQGALLLLGWPEA